MAEPTGYEAGLEAGKTDERLSSHDRHFEMINGSLDRIVNRLGSLEKLIQHLEDLAHSRAQALAADLLSRDSKVLAVAQSLKEADEVRRNTSDQRWTPIQRTMAIVGFLITIVLAVLTIVVTR